MNSKISIASNYYSEEILQNLLTNFDAYIEKLFVVGSVPKSSSAKIEVLGGYGVEFGATLVEALNKATTPLLGIVTGPVLLAPLANNFETWIAKIDSSFSYASHMIAKEGVTELQPLNDYQLGSVRDDFDFGPLVIVDVAKSLNALRNNPELFSDDNAGLYGLRLALSRVEFPKRHAVPVYEARSLLKENSEGKHFAYVSSKSAVAQKNFERVFTNFSKVEGFWLKQRPACPEDSASKFLLEASVIIPVRDRLGKIDQATLGALGQKTNFPFNVIVVDNHSKDGTTEALRKLAAENSNLVHLIPERTDLGIGGCWDLAIRDSRCGRFAVQLDSDDLYSGTHVLQEVVTSLKNSDAVAMVGSYQLTDKDLNPLSSDSIDHREWTDLNGHNNALRINGFGAPRAYRTQFAREIGFPNVSYGEDYAMMIALSRQFKIARSYNTLYLCRRWEGNSDAQPSVAKLNSFNAYKDGLRTAEIEIRKRMPKNDN